jgi:hypothetical protein
LAAMRNEPRAIGSGWLSLAHAFGPNDGRGTGGQTVRILAGDQKRGARLVVVLAHPEIFADSGPHTPPSGRRSAQAGSEAAFSR